MPTSPEQIAANIAASRARRFPAGIPYRTPEERKAARKARKVEQARRETLWYLARDRVTPYPDLLGKRVGFIIETRHGYYKPFFGTVYNSPGDYDAFVNVEAFREPVETKAAAVATLEAQAELIPMAHLFREPRPGFGMMPNYISALYGEKPAGDHDSEQERIYAELCALEGLSPVLPQRVVQKRQQEAARAAYWARQPVPTDPDFDPDPEDPTAGY